MWKPVDLIVVIITLTVCVVLMFATSEHLFGKAPEWEMSGEKSNAIKATIASLITIVSIYVGRRMKGHDE